MKHALYLTLAIAIGTGLAAALEVAA